MKRKRRSGSKARAPGLSWLVLAESDDFITRNLIDNTYYWIKTRKVGRGFQKPLVIDNTIILRLLTKYIIETDKPNIKKCSGLLMKHPVTRKFLERYVDDEHVLREFRLHLQRYLSLFHPDCGFEVNVTNRYRSRSGSEEACIVARKDYDEGEEIRFLTGSFAELLPEDELSLDQNDFSVINISSRELPCLMLGPSRFVNHNCSGNARFGAGGKGMKIIAVRKILTGEEITVTYSPNYFGKDNKDCLCVTCERDHKGFFDPDRFEIPDTAPLIDVPTSEDEDDSKTDVIVIDDSDNNTKESTPMSKNGQEDTSDSDTSPELLDPREVLDWGKRLSILRQVPLTEYQEIGLLHKIPEQAKGDLIGGRVLRSRNKIQAPSSQSNQWSILNMFPRNTCLDSLALDSEGIAKEVLKARAQNRTLHSLFASDIYPNSLMEARELKTTYDCLHCGIYFKVDIQHRVKEYCHRCCRHQRVYRLAWPYTRNIPMKTFSLLLEEKIGRASIGELAERKIIGLSRQRISPERIETCDMTRHVPEGVGALMHGSRRWSAQADVKSSSSEMYLPARKSILDEFTSDSSEDEYHSAQDFEIASPKSSKMPKHACSSDGSPIVKELKLNEDDEKQVQSLRSQSPLPLRSPRTRSTTAPLPVAEPKDIAYSKPSAKLPVQLSTPSQTKNSQAIKLYRTRNSIVVNDQECPIEIDSESGRSDDSDDNSPTKEEILMSSSKIQLEKQVRQPRTVPRPVVTKTLTITKKRIITRSSCRDSLDQRTGSKLQETRAFLAKNENVVVISDSDSEDEIARILL
jgi:hypothetical protein